METVLTISEIILFLSVSALCIYLITAVGKINETISNLERSIKNLQNKLDPILENVNIISEKFKKISESISEQIDIFRSTLLTFKDIGKDILEFERNIKQTIEKPIHDILNLIFGFISGLKSFSTFFKKDKEENEVKI